MSALAEAAASLLPLQAGLRHGYDAGALPGAADAIAALDRFIQSAGWQVDVSSLLNALMAGDVGPTDVEDARRALEEFALQEVLAAASGAPAIRDGQPAVLANGAWPTAEDTSWKCWARRHSTCPGHCISRGTCLCACHARAATPAPASRPETPPPPSGDGDEEAVELRAARDATGETLPPSGDVELGEMACLAGVDTEPPAPGSTPWWDDQPTVRF